MRPCCVPGCNDKTSTRHALPSDKRIRDIWVLRINNPKLVGIDDSRYLKNYTVCRIHFETICFDQHQRLKKYALPTLHLPGLHSGDVEDCFSYPVQTQQTYITPTKLREALSYVESKPAESSSPGDLHVRTPRKIYGKRKISREILPSVTEIQSKKRFVDTADSQPSTSFQPPDSSPSTLFQSEPQPSTSFQLEESVEELAASLGITVLPSSPVESQIRRTLPKQQKRSNKRRGILEQIQVTRKQQLTPKAKKLYAKLRSLRHRMSQQRSAKKQLALLSQQSRLMNHLKDVNETTIKFITTQLQTQKLKPRGRRFSVDFKVFSLALYKQSGKAYRFLSHLFSLPSRKVLTRLLNQIPFQCGINKHIFEHLKSAVAKRKPIEKYCSLIFDEISLQSGLQYNSKFDVIDGLEDYGALNRRAKFADHALLFMLRGIFRKWKQPICFTFCEGTTSTADLTRLLKEIIREIRAAGLNVICTICDQGATNQAAINSLINDTNIYCHRNNIENRFLGYLIDDIEVIHLYDFPHLMKGIRNNLLDKKLHYKLDGVQRVASWSHVIRLYEIDQKQGKYYSHFPKLTDEHIFPDKIRKMRVKNCTQVFSHTVGSAMRIAALTSADLPSDSQFYLDPQAVDTAELLLFFDQLFDSVNGNTLHPAGGKELRCVLSERSPHIPFWNNAIRVLESMVYVDDKNRRHTTPSLKNWIFSLRSLMYMWTKLQQEGFRFLSPRNLNQDSLENYFSCIRSHGVRNTNPTCTSFISSNKALLVNNFVSPHSVSANCEEDGCSSALDTLRNFVETPVNLHLTDVPENFPHLDIFRSLPNIPTISLSVVNDYATPYVAGFVLKKIFNVSKNGDCVDCKKTLCGGATQENILITTRHYRTSRLQEPSKQFVMIFKRCTNIILYYLPRLITSFKIKRQLMNIVKENLYSEIVRLFCSMHHSCITNYIQIVTNVVMFSYIKNINKILNGTDLRRAKQDFFTALAFDKYRKTLKHRRRSKI